MPILRNFKAIMPPEHIWTWKKSCNQQYFFVLHIRIGFKTDKSDYRHKEYKLLISAPLSCFDTFLQRGNLKDTPENILPPVAFSFMPSSKN